MDKIKIDMTQTNTGDMNNLEKDLSSSIDGNISSSKNISQSFKIKKLQANSVVMAEKSTPFL